MKLAPSFFSLLAAAFFVASPLVVSAQAEENSLEKRAIFSSCDGWATSAQGSYTVIQNLWGQASGTGSQCLNLDSVSEDVFAWTTTWSWSGGTYSVKSYDNIAYNLPTGIKVSSITSIPTNWDWSQTSSGTPVNDVAYDLMTASSATSTTHVYEIMVWLAAYGGAGPLSTTGSAVATLTTSGHSWKLFDGYNGNTRVFSFVATSNIYSYSGDLLDFLKYLNSHNGFPTSQYLTVLQAGSEPFTGSNVKLTTSKYNVFVETGSSSGDTAAVWGNVVERGTPVQQLALLGQHASLPIRGTRSAERDESLIVSTRGVFCGPQRGLYIPMSPSRTHTRLYCYSRVTS